MTLTKSDIALAQASAKALRLTLRSPKRKDGALVLGQGAGQITVKLPKQAVTLLAQTLEHLGEGTPVSVMPKEAVMTTQAAADYLHISRPTLIKLLKEKKIPFHHVDAHRRLSASAVQRLKTLLYKDRQTALDELTAQAQKLKLGY